MAQHDYDIANQSFPSFRSDLNSVLEAVNTSNSGTSRPTSAVAGTVWLDVTNATNPTLKFFDGTDDISLAQFDYSANTVNWLDSTVIADFNLVDDTTPQLGGNLDVNGNSIVSVSNGNITFTPDGTGKVIIDGLSYPSSDGTSGQFLKTDGAGNLSFDTVTTAGTTLTTQGDILYRDGSGLARLGAGTSGQALVTQGTGANPIWSTVGGSNTPSFFAVSTPTEDNVNVADNTLTKMTFSTEVYDTDSCYDNSTNYRFTPTEAGKYFVFTKAMSDNVIANATTKLEFYKNGSQMNDQYRMRFKTGGTVGDIEHTLILSAIIDMNGSTDYIEVYAAHDNGGNTGGLYDKHFGAYKLIGV